jgi:hypothetical protein
MSLTVLTTAVVAVGQLTLLQELALAAVNKRKPRFIEQ